MQSHGNAAAVPVLQLGVTSSYGYGWKQLWPHFLELFLVFIIYLAITVVGGVITNRVVGLNFVFSFLVSTPLGYGVSWAYLKVARQEKMEVGDMFAGFKNYWNVVLAGLLVFVIIAIGLVLIIVPGIVFICKLAFVPYLVVDKKMKTVEAVKESWRMTNGYGWKVFLLLLLGIPIILAGLICLGVGVIISMMWINMALASLYYAISKQVGGQQPQPVAPPIQPA